MSTRWMLACVLALFVAGDASARPNYGRNCKNCHSAGEPVLGALSVGNHDGLFDPDESGTGATDRGPLKTFVVTPGQTVDFAVTIDLGTLFNYAYAVELKRMEIPGVVAGGVLAFSPDTDWFLQTGALKPDPARPYYTTPSDAGIPFFGPQTFTFSMFIDPATTPDVYDLEFAMAGQPDFFYADEHFYLQVIPEPETLALLLAGASLLLLRARPRRIAARDEAGSPSGRC